MKAADGTPSVDGSEIRKRLEGAYIICGLGVDVPPDWQVVIDAFVKAAQAQGHLARLASERYDKLLEMEREQLALQAALPAAEERERKLRTALREARGFIAAVEVEEGLTIDNLIEMIDSALKHGNEALEAR